MNNLNYENFPTIYENILGNLTIKELFNLSLVNKKFNLIVKDFKIKELSILNYCSVSIFENYYSLKENYCYIDKSMDYNYLNNFYQGLKSAKSLLNSSLFNFKNLKILQLAISLDKGERLDSNLINRFIELEYLRIILTGITSNSDFFEISLPNLIGFGLYNCFFTQNIYHLIKLKNSNKLKFFHIMDEDANNYYKRIKIENPLTIEYLKIDCLINFEKFISSFKNAKIIDINELMTPFDLSPFQKLEKIKIKKVIRDNLELIYEKINSYKNKIEFYYRNIRIFNHDQLMKIENNYKTIKKDQKKLNFYMENYELIDIDTKLFKQINYNDLINLVYNEIPIDFFHKFKNINIITIDKTIDNSNDLIRFIFNCKNLYRLNFVDTSLDSNFYDQLPSITSIVELKIIENNNEIKIDFNFLKRFHYLEVLIVNREIDIDLIYYLNRLGYFYLLFELNSTKYLIEKMPYNRKNYEEFEFLSSDILMNKTGIKFDKVLKLFNNLKIKKSNNRISLFNHSKFRFLLKPFRHFKEKDENERKKCYYFYYFKYTEINCDFHFKTKNGTKNGYRYKFDFFNEGLYNY